MSPRTFARDGLLLAGSVAVALAIGEAGLAALGQYDDLANNELVASNALWAPRPDTTRGRDHPDIAYEVEIVYDADGVRNHGPTPTSAKDHIVGFFGDSFTENWFVKNEFTYTSILQNEILADGWSAVNFGVSGYGIDQEYIRYEAFAGLDVRHVFVQILNNDLSNAHETGLAYIGEDGVLRFRAPSASRWRRLLGRLRLTYLVMDGYLRLRHAAASPEHLADRVAGERRAEDLYAGDYGDAADTTRDYLSEDPSPRTLELARVLNAVLDRWARVAASRGQTFTIIVPPFARDIAFARKLGLADRMDVIYLHEAMLDGAAPGWCPECRFKNDPHWNEDTNLGVALALAGAKQLRPLPRPDLDLGAVEAEYRARIAAYLASHEPR